MEIADITSADIIAAYSDTSPQEENTQVSADVLKSMSTKRLSELHKQYIGVVEFLENTASLEEVEAAYEHRKEIAQELFIRSKEKS